MKRILGYAVLVGIGYIAGLIHTDNKVAELDDKYSKEMAMMASALEHYDNMLADIEVRNTREY